MGINIQVIFVLSQAFNQIIKPMIMYMITLSIPKFLQKLRMSIKNINFDDKKNKKKEFYKNKKVTKIDEIDVIKILVFKIEPYHMVQRIHWIQFYWIQLVYWIQ